MHARRHPNRLNRFVRGTVIGILALAAAHTSAVAVAQVATVAGGAVELPARGDQDPQAPALPKVLVTGYRGSLEQALNLKHDMAVEADTILAEDMRGPRIQGH